MTLDLNLVAAQVAAMAEGVRQDHQEWEGRLGRAMGVLHSTDPGALERKIASSKTTWLPAVILDSLSGAYPLPPRPPDFTVIATDGSHIDVDRNRPLRCGLINIGDVVLDYGANPCARLRSWSTLYSPEDLEKREMEGASLATTCATMEVDALAALAKGGDGPTLGLLDGTLILWNLVAQGTPERVVRDLLEKGLLKSLDELKKMTEIMPLAVASYISFPRSRDVVNALRIAHCPSAHVNCDECFEKRFPERACDAVGGLVDRDIFGMLLKPGERSPVFSSRSHVLKYYREHDVQFFFLKAQMEVARIEIPRWVGESKALLDMVHAITFDQCRRGQGYPVALSEAHERAVITGPERQHFWHMVDKVLVDSHLSTRTSLKSQSKRTRWV